MKKLVKGDVTIPLYQQLKTTILKQIETGTLVPGDKLLSEAQLQEEFSMSRITVRKAINELVSEGYLTKLQGKGTFVKRREMASNKILSLSDVCAMQGKEVVSEVLSCQRIEADNEYLELFQENQIIEVIRLRKVNGVAVVLETCYFSGQYTFLLEADLSHSLYEVLHQQEIYPSYKGLHEVRIHHLQSEEAELFNVRDHLEVIAHKGTVYDKEGKLVHAIKELVRVDLPDVFTYYL